MNLNKFELAGIVASLVLVFMAGVFAFSHFAYADDVPVDPCTDIFSQIPGMGCDGDENQTPVDACDITPCDNDGPSLGEQITCEVFRELMEQGEPIPQGFDASDCDDDGGNGGGGNTPAACADGSDNDNDGKVDMADPGCTDANDTDETDPTTGGGGGGGSGSGGGGSGGGGGGGGGSVLGTTTPIACDMYLTEFIKFGGNNNPEQVKRLQHVLKNYEGASVEESGEYDQATLSAVHAFQTKYWDTILAPWNIKESTGFVYLTTRKKANEIYCKNEVQFPLSSEENTLIEASKKVQVAAAAKTVSPVPKPAVETEKKLETSETSTVTEGATKRSGWGAVGDFFRRIFDRVR